LLKFVSIDVLPSDAALKVRAHQTLVGQKRSFGFAARSGLTVRLDF
jgi:hypothetical protein